jgi:hypothetical protein
VDDIVESTLNESDHLLARRAAEMRGAHVVSSELLLKQAVNATHLLLLAQTETVLREFDASLTVLARGIRATGNRALL